MDLDLDIPFKGARTYLQSANAWDTVAGHLLAGDLGLADNFADPATVLDVTFRTLIGQTVAFRLVDAATRSRDALAQIVMRAPDGTRAMAELHGTGGEVMSRIEDVEGGMKPGVVITDTQARLDAPIPMSLSQVYVAMIKFWHQARIDNDCKWLATRLQLPLSCLAAAPEHVVVTPVTILKDGQGSVSDVRAGQDDTLSGRIYFYKT